MTYPPYQAPPPPTPDRRATNRKILLVAAFAVTALASCAVGAAVGSSSAKTPAAAAAPVRTDTVYVTNTVTAPAAGPTATAAPATTKAPPAAPKPKPTIDDGKVVVGDDIPAGTYEVRGAPSDCYYEITRHGTSDIVDNSFGTGGHLTVVLKKGQDFETERCGTWTKK